jgi:hypothetical protein
MPFASSISNLNGLIGARQAAAPFSASAASTPPTGSASATCRRSGDQHLARRDGGKCLDALRIERPAGIHAALDDELVAAPSEVGNDFAAATASFEKL